MGIDEAGRGPVLGPMVVAAVVFDVSTFLSDIGVRDSKKLTPKARDRIFPLIEDEAKWYKILVVWPDVIDRFVSKNNLNDLECNVMADLIDSFPGSSPVYIDSPLNPNYFTAMLTERLKKPKDINCYFKADTLFSVVSAASILAKVVRDRIVKDLRFEYGDFGSGYPSDKKTRKFISDIREEVPFFVRKSWKTFKELRWN